MIQNEQRLEEALAKIAELASEAVSGGELSDQGYEDDQEVGQKDQKVDHNTANQHSHRPQIVEEPANGHIVGVIAEPGEIPRLFRPIGQRVRKLAELDLGRLGRRRRFIGRTCVLFFGHRSPLR